MSGFPNVIDAFDVFEECVTFRQVRTAIVDFEVASAPFDEEEFVAVVQPIPPRKLIIKPEGQRDWKWLTLWTEKVLKIDSIIQDNDGRQYRVMTSTDWRGGGYLEYELAEQPI